MTAITVQDLDNAKLDVDLIAEVATSLNKTATDRKGNTKLTVAGAIATMTAVNVRGPWATGTSYSLKDVFTDGGIAYITVVPHVSTSIEADLAAGKIAVYQGALLSDVNAVRSDFSDADDMSKGDAMVAVKRTQQGAQDTTVHNWIEAQEFSLAGDFLASGDGNTDDTVAVASAEAASYSTGKTVNGAGQTYAVATLPSNYAAFRNAAFKYGEVRHITEDYLNQKTSKITNGKCYLSHPQDKCYVLNNQIKVWLSIQDSHTDGDVRPCVVVSDDGGVSWQEPELLDETLFGHSCWSAGVDGANEYVFVRRDSDFAYFLYKRPIPSGPSANYYGGWTITPVTFPTPSWTTGQPVMVHSFAVGPGGAIVVGYSYGEGAGLYRSMDQGASWTEHTLQQTSDAEEPTVKWDSVTGAYYGFVRSGEGLNPQFWVSTDNLGSFTLYRAPDGYFGPKPLGDATVPLQIVDGILHAVTAYRNGTLEGEESDSTASAFYIRADLSKGANIWQHARTYRLGTLYHAETGGASGLGQGSVVHYKDKIFLFYGNEERTGTFQAGTNTSNPLNRINNIYQTVLFLRGRNGVIDFRSYLVDDRSANNPFRRVGGLRWLGKEGKWTFSLGEKLGSQYAAAIANTGFNTLIFDLLAGSGGMTFSTEGETFVGFYVAGPKGVGGSRIDTSTGTWQAFVNGAEAFRWDASAPSLRPGQDNTRSCGSVTRRWSEVWAGNGTIQTSDEEHKEQIQAIDERLLRAWGRVQFQQYKMRDAVALKGQNDARWHIGVIAQRVKAELEAEGLDPFAYGLLCYDEWPEIPEKVCPETGAIIEPYQAAGRRYSIRYDEALALECAYLRWRLSGGGAEVTA
ncbi:tail fiber domain-containing protein [Cupriavidus gilardii]|uniref:tail fiber domain-containing protein n=1 Tax=Cupriavidus gilardii TaxID=82541 RepID=UPI0021B15A08|nr:tail fiber domain-containing protein [Cupriavidus gilardii]UXC37360.1 tail fiber domain-containing protein [Cupriavidus gilardii]